MNHVFSPSFSFCFFSCHSSRTKSVRRSRYSSTRSFARFHRFFSDVHYLSRRSLFSPLPYLSLSLSLPYPRESALTRIRSRVSRSLDDRLSDSLLFLSERSADSWRMNLTWYVRTRPGSIYHSRCKTVPDLPSPLLSSPTPDLSLF